MDYLIPLFLTFLFAFSYKIVDQLVKLIFGTKYKLLENLIVYLWGGLIVVLVLIYEGDFVFRLPNHYESAVLLIGVVFIINLFIAGYSGYRPVGIRNITNFVIIYPIVEEAIFRGTIIPLLNKSYYFEPTVQIFYVPVTFSIIISAVLFAISHLQYYKLNKTSVKYMMFAFVGGIVFGLIANLTKSILIPILLHIEFNILAAYYSNRASKKKMS